MWLENCAVEAKFSLNHKLMPSSSLALFQADQLNTYFLITHAEPSFSGEYSDWDKSLASLTALERSQWASLRQKYFSTGINKESLDVIESAAFHVCTDL